MTMCMLEFALRVFPRLLLLFQYVHLCLLGINVQRKKRNGMPHSDKVVLNLKERNLFEHLIMMILWETTRFAICHFAKTNKLACDCPMKATVYTANKIDDGAHSEKQHRRDDT